MGGGEKGFLDYRNRRYKKKPPLVHRKRKKEKRILKGKSSLQGGKRRRRSPSGTGQGKASSCSLNSLRKEEGSKGRGNGPAHHFLDLTLRGGGGRSTKKKGNATDELLSSREDVCRIGRNKSRVEIGRIDGV